MADLYKNCETSPAFNPKSAGIWGPEQLEVGVSCLGWTPNTDFGVSFWLPKTTPKKCTDPFVYFRGPRPTPSPKSVQDGGPDGIFFPARIQQQVVAQRSAVVLLFLLSLRPGGFPWELVFGKCLAFLGKPLQQLNKWRKELEPFLG